MNLTMNEIIEKDSELTEVIDAQISHEHKTRTVQDDGIYAFMCDCGAVFDEQGEQIK